MKCKAKRIDNGEWVEGYFRLNQVNRPIISVGYNKAFSNVEVCHEIDPKTLCQQVRGTEFFEGDFVQVGFPCGTLEKAYWSYSDSNKKWVLRGTYFSDEEVDWQPTGKNLYDYKWRQKN